MRATVQATRRPAHRGQVRQGDRLTVTRVVVVAVLLQVAGWAWHVAQSAQYERSITSLQAQLRQAQDEAKEAQLALSGRLDEQRQGPQD